MKKVRAPLNESLNNLRRLAGLNEQANQPLSAFLTRYGNNEAAIIAYDDENGDEGDAERPFSELARIYGDKATTDVQAASTATAQTLVADIDKISKSMGFIDGAFDDTAAFWQTDWLPDYEGQLLLVATRGYHEDLGDTTQIYCIKV